MAGRSPGWQPKSVAVLLVLAPVCAEYLSAYDDSTGDVVRLVFGLAIFVPLYGVPALLIREVARRRGLGWTAIVLLGTAFGVIQAGVVDQSLFSEGYRGIDAWDATTIPTYLPALGFSVANLLNFVGGHAIYSIGAPIALAEAVGPTNPNRAWLGPRALLLVAVLYVAASALVLWDTQTHESNHASPGQLLGCILVVVVLVSMALRRRRVVMSAGQVAHRPITVFAVVVLLSGIYNLAPTTWAGCAFVVASLVVACALIYRDSRASGWSLRHVIAVAAAPLVVRGMLAFTYFPLIGQVSPARKYGHNVVLLGLVIGVILLAWRRTARTAPSSVRSLTQDESDGHEKHSEPDLRP